MIEVTGNLWTYRYAEKPVLCITTNGAVRRDGCCVMGRGCAREAAKRFPSLPKMLGDHLKKHGNVVGTFVSYPSPDAASPTILTFPVKHVWSEPADPDLILRSARALDCLAREQSGTLFILPRPGCGNGQLKWENVKPLLEFLPDNVLVITNEERCVYGGNHSTADCRCDPHDNEEPV